MFLSVSKIGNMQRHISKLKKLLLFYYLTLYTLWYRVWREMRPVGVYSFPNIFHINGFKLLTVQPIHCKERKKLVVFMSQNVLESGRVSNRGQVAKKFPEVSRLPEYIYKIRTVQFSSGNTTDGCERLLMCHQSSHLGLCLSAATVSLDCSVTWKMQTLMFAVLRSDNLLTAFFLSDFRGLKQKSLSLSYRIFRSIKRHHLLFFSQSCFSSASCHCVFSSF